MAKWIVGLSGLLKEAIRKDIYILTAFGFYVKVTRKDLKYSLGKGRFKFSIEMTNAVFIDNVKRL